MLVSEESAFRERASAPATHRGPANRPAVSSALHACDAIAELSTLITGICTYGAITCQDFWLFFFFCASRPELQEVQLTGPTALSTFLRLNFHRPHSPVGRRLNSPLTHPPTHVIRARPTQSLSSHAHRESSGRHPSFPASTPPDLASTPPPDLSSLPLLQSLFVGGAHLTYIE